MSVRRRRGGPTWALVVDVLRQARLSRSWAVLAVLVVAILAVLLGVFAQVVVPWLIYPAL